MKLLPSLTIGMLAIFALPVTTMAGAETGFYLGAGAGMASIGDLDS